MTEPGSTDPQPEDIALEQPSPEQLEELHEASEPGQDASPSS